MSQLFFDPVSGFVPMDDGHDAVTTVDPTLARVFELDRWEARAAQWRARALAEAVFGGEVDARLTGHTIQGPFRGLLHLRVPFTGLAEHRAREASFTAAAALDPVLARVPFLYVFGPALTPAPVASR